MRSEFFVVVGISMHFDKKFVNVVVVVSHELI